MPRWSWNWSEGNLVSVSAERKCVQSIPKLIIPTFGECIKASLHHVEIVGVIIQWTIYFEIARKKLSTAQNVIRNIVNVEERNRTQDTSLWHTIKNWVRSGIAVSYSYLKTSFT